jgi:hypothetical protein
MLGRIGRQLERMLGCGWYFVGPGNPWTVSSGLQRNLWFIALPCDTAELATLSAREQHVAKVILAGISRS